MGAGLFPALLVALSGVLAGGSILLVTALLASDRGRANALAFLVGYVGAYAAAMGGVIALWGGARGLLARPAEPLFAAHDLKEAFGDRLYARVARHRSAEEPAEPAKDGER